MSEREKPFVPVFGPNGAVMNAPGMDPKLRAELEAQEQQQQEQLHLPPTAWLFRVASFIAIFASLSVGGWLVFDDRLREIPFDIFAGMVVVAIAGLLGLRLHEESKRWSGRPRLREEGARLPPMNWVLATLAADIIWMAGGCIGLIALHPAATAITPGLRDGALTLWLVALVPALWLRARAVKRGWA